MTRLPEDQAHGGWLHGLSAFTTLRTRHGHALLWEAHLKRLRASCAFLGLPDPLEASRRVPPQLESLPEGRLRLTVTPVGLFWTHAPLAAVARRPLSVWLSDVQVHPQLARHKTGNYLPYLLAARQARERRADEALLLDAGGHVVDASRTSLLLERGGELLVPEGGLPGLTRELLLREWGRPFRRVAFRAAELPEVERAWLAGSGVGVLPVGELASPAGRRALEVSWPAPDHPALRPPA